MAVNQLSFYLTNRQHFRISLLKRNSEGAVNLQLVLYAWNFISFEAQRVCVIVSLPQIFTLMHGSDYWLLLQITTLSFSSASLWYLCLVPANSSWFHFLVDGSSLLQLVPARYSLFQVVPGRSSSFLVLVCMLFLTVIFVLGLVHIKLSKFNLKTLPRRLLHGV